MKKVLSVLLAAAMVMGMSVSAFAASWTDGANGKVDIAVNKVVEFADEVVIIRDGLPVPVSAGSTDITHDDGKALALEPGDDLYFPLVWVADSYHALKASTANDIAIADAALVTKPDLNTGDNYFGPIDTTWSINILSNDYVDAASYYTVPAANKAWSTATTGHKYVKVEIADEFTSTATTIDLRFEMYLADGDKTSEHVIVEGTYSGTANANGVSYKYTNNAAKIAKWTAPNEKGTAVFDFSDKVYFTVDMLPLEKVILNLSTAYNKNVDALFSNSADLEFYNFKGEKDEFYKEGELFIPADEDTFVYEILSDVDDEDPELVAVDATYDDEYKVAKVNKEYAGWVIDTDTLGYYVISDEELVVEEEEVEVEVEAPAETDKANPETGANDFVGAAVALAVVSVAAAGALALKK